VQNILRKIDASDRTQAAVWAVRKGLPRWAIGRAVRQARRFNRIEGVGLASSDQE